MKSLEINQNRPASSHFFANTNNTMPSRKKTVADLADADLKGKKVLVRADLNVPLDVSFFRHIVWHHMRRAIFETAKSPKEEIFWILF